MKCATTFLKAALCVSLIIIGSSAGLPPLPASAQPAMPSLAESLLGPCQRNGEIQWKDGSSEQDGCLIWFYATAGNGRFNTYVYQQRLGALIDWYDILKTQTRDDRFRRWGLINDQTCEAGGEETYGFDRCPGDDKLLEYVGKPGYKDPACDLFKDASPPAGNLHELKDRESSCFLEFGTSTGVMGFRKFPNPKFNRAQWLALNNGKLGTWEGYTLPKAYRVPEEQYKKLKDSKTLPLNPLLDGSIEPPFMIGMSCGGCHIGFDPLHPPANPAHPQWRNISGTVGNQYVRVAQIFGSGMPPDSLERQTFTRNRPGTVDTSAIPHDQVFNPGTMNALINLRQRIDLTKYSKEFEHRVVKWRQASQCPHRPDGMLADERRCWCEPGKDKKCWERSQEIETVLHILKGGDDSIGAHEALQRVYLNIGSCAESSLVNHLTDMRRMDSSQRNFGQTPVDIGQTRRDCPHFRAIEDRLPDILNFLLTGRPTPLYKAKGLRNPKDLENQLNGELVAHGRKLFTERCAECHSSQRNTPKYLGPDDWLGNDQLTPLVSELKAEPFGSNQSRALHSNHMAGHVWEEYASLDYRVYRPDIFLRVPSDGGRGYYRNISLLSLWAHAPFLHNNSVGPELCGGGKDKDEFYDSPYVESISDPLEPIRTQPEPDCWRFDTPYSVSVEGRFELYKESMDDLLNLTRKPKVTMLTREAEAIGPLGIRLIFPKGKPAALIVNFRHKEFVRDLVDYLNKPEPEALKDLERKYGPANATKIRTVFDAIKKNPKSVVTEAHKLSPIYSTSVDLIENGDPQRHPMFNKPFSQEEKKALIAFLATL
jgi:cytochrome c2